jgi:hypothetical protein
MTTSVTGDDALKTVSPLAADSSSPVSPSRWRCSFRARAGAQAHATVASLEAAATLAERHAGVSLGGAARWLMAQHDVWTLSTEYGDYQLERI